MVNEKVVFDTIKKMQDSGLEESVIVNTLKDIGLTESQAKEFVSKASVDAEKSISEPVNLKQPVSEQKELIVEETNELIASPIDEKEEIAEKTAQKIKQHLAEENRVKELKETTAQIQLEEHAQKINDVHAKVSALSAQTPSSELDKQLKAIQAQLDLLSEKIDDTKAQTNATKQLMEKILEANREIIAKL